MRTKRRNDKWAKRRDGFTLLELILAMAISLVVATALASAMFVAYRARTSAMQAVETSRQTDFAGDILVRELENCHPPTGVLRGPFIGAVDTVDFFISGPESKATVQGDVRKIEYTLEPDPAVGSNGANLLVRRVWTNLLAQVIPDPVEEIICKNVTSFALAYYDGTTWTDSWDSTQHTNTLPLAVQITIQLGPTATGGPARQTIRVVPLSCAKATTTVTGLGGGF